MTVQEILDANSNIGRGLPSCLKKGAFLRTGPGFLCAGFSAVVVIFLGCATEAAIRYHDDVQTYSARVIAQNNVQLAEGKAFLQRLDDEDALSLRRQSEQRANPYTTSDND